MRSLINDVLTLSRLDESALRRRARCSSTCTPWPSAWRAAWASFAADQQACRCAWRATARCIAGSETLAEEMLYNLIENGIRYNHEGGSVVMRVEAEPPARPGSGLPGEDAAGQVVVRVSDTGPGIPAEHAREGVRALLPRGQEPFEGDGRHGPGPGHREARRALPSTAPSRWRAPRAQGTTFVLRLPGRKVRASQAGCSPHVSTDNDNKEPRRSIRSFPDWRSKSASGPAAAQMPRESLRKRTVGTRRKLGASRWAATGPRSVKRFRRL